MAAASTRVGVLRSHLRTDTGAEACAAGVKEKEKALGTLARSLDFKNRGQQGAAPRQRANGSWSWRGVTDFLSHMDKMQVVPDTGRLLDRLPGPTHDRARYPGGREEVVRSVLEGEGAGQSHVFWGEMQRRYGKRGHASNLVVPLVSFSRTSPPVMTHQVLLMDPGDCQRIARDHVKKQPNFTVFILDSVLSTTDVDSWRSQRKSLTEAFVPRKSLAHLFPISRDRARVAAERLSEMAGPSGDAVVNISEFMLHEAMAQLQLALFGFDDKFMNQTNKPFRDAMGGRGDVSYLMQFLPKILAQMKGKEHTSPSEAVASGRAVHGPLSRIIDTTTKDDDAMQKIGNAMIFAFAGHDTTGHTMTWLVFELSKHPAYQQRLHAEADALFESLGGRDLAYTDLHRLPFLTRCIVETLRLWPAVPNGTFRELVHDDWVTGNDGERVMAPKGTFVQVTTWPRHRSPELWGDDAHVFNPDRQFTEDELWGGRGFAARNPSTERFSPFTYTPRDCIGKNFAQMEMRAILYNLLRRFSFELAAPQTAHDPAHYLGLNYATLGPQDLRKEPRQPPPPPDMRAADRDRDKDPRVPTGLYVHARPRR